MAGVEPSVRIELLWRFRLSAPLCSAAWPVFVPVVRLWHGTSHLAGMLRKGFVCALCIHVLIRKFLVDDLCVASFFLSAGTLIEVANHCLCLGEMVHNQFGLCLFTRQLFRLVCSLD